MEETRALVLAAAPLLITNVVAADVADTASLEAAFKSHVTKFGSLHACFNNAGVGERADWRSVVDINLNAVIHGTRLATRAMLDTGSAQAPGKPASTSPASIVNVASAGGFFPMPMAPVYSATKAAVVLYSKSLAHLAQKGVRVNALCPQFTDTALVSQQMAGVGEAGAKKILAETGGGLLTVEQVGHLPLHVPHQLFTRSPSIVDLHHVLIYTG